MLAVWLVLVLAAFTAAQVAGPFLTYDQLQGKPYTVTYDERSFIINGQRTLLLGGSFHYPRASPGDWPLIFQKAKADGLNHIQTYVFWNYHEFKQGVYDFSGRGNLTQFIEAAGQAGLFVDVRIGPYVCAEWNYGGLPVWLNWIEGIYFRMANPQWEYYMGNFVKLIANITEPYLARNGGPVILAQIENEYHGNSPDYITWCGNLTVELDLDIPWVMCNGESAPQTINTCNGDDCAASYAPGHSQQFPGQPLGWTENEGWFEAWNTVSDGPGDDRTAQDMANVIAKWVAVGAAHHNYYMWYGGNHVGRWAGSSITNMYADGVNWHADLTPNEPKHSHLVTLHEVLAAYNSAIMSSPIQINNSIPIDGISNAAQAVGCNAASQSQNITFANGEIKTSSGYCLIGTCNDCYPALFAPCNGSASQQFAYSSTTGTFKSSASGLCVDLYGGTGPLIGMYACNGQDNQAWTINKYSISSQIGGSPCMSNFAYSSVSAYIYQNSTTSVTFMQNTLGTVEAVTYNGQSYTLAATSVLILDKNGNVVFNTSDVNTNGVPTQRVYTNFAQNLSWEYWQETVPSSLGLQIQNVSPLEQLNVTQDETEYLFYNTQLATITNGATLSIGGWCANSYSVFVDGAFIGSTFDDSHSEGPLTMTVTLNGVTSQGPHTLSILSGSLGLNNGVAWQVAGTDQEHKGIVGAVSIGGQSITDNTWNHRPFLSGELLSVFEPESTSVQWTPTTGDGVATPLTWFKTTFPLPPDNGSVVFNALGLSRGHFYVNGIDMGRYWTIQQDGEYVQQYYYIPRDYLQSTNTLVIIDELGVTNLSQVTIAFSNVQIP